MPSTEHGLNDDQLKADLDALAKRDPAIATAIEKVGYPPARIRPEGYLTLLRTIVGQQVSVAAASSIWAKLEAAIGPDMQPDALLAQEPEALRACGLSRQKQSYARSLAERVQSGELALDALSPDDETAIAELTKVKGIGRWSAEIYLLFAQGRRDIWPAGDLAVQNGATRIMGLNERPSEKEVRLLAEPWRPYRSAAALLSWQYYSNPTL